MIELKVAAKETVKLTFGGSAGWEAFEVVTTQEDWVAREKERAWLRDEKKRLELALEQARNAHIPAGATLFLIDQQLVDGLKILVGMKPEPASCERAALAWRPIITAPQDGTVVLLCISHIPVTITGRWDKEMARWHEMRSDFIAEQITHWMPLPEPPK